MARTLIEARVTGDWSNLLLRLRRDWRRRFQDFELGVALRNHDRLIGSDVFKYLLGAACRPDDRQS